MFVAFYIYKKTRNGFGLFLSALLGEAVMVLGYFVFEALFMGLGLGAVASIPYNCIQGGVSFIVAIVVFAVLKKNKYIASESEVLK